MLHLGKENRYLHAIRHASIAIHGLSIATQAVEWIANLISSILDSFLLAMPIPQAVEGGGGGEPQSGWLMVHAN